MDHLGAKTDEELLAMTARVPAAYGAFYDRHEAAILRFFIHRTGRAELAADLAAEVFASALSSLKRFEPSRGSARAWLFGIARNELADTWRRGRVEDRARRRIGLEPIALEDEELERISQLGRPVVSDLLLGLPNDLRLAIEGRVLQERDYAELAETLECSESVVRKRVSRGLDKIRRELEADRDLSS